MARIVVRTLPCSTACVPIDAPPWTTPYARSHLHLHSPVKEVLSAVFAKHFPGQNSRTLSSRMLRLVARPGRSSQLHTD